jgi:hypothetical protein
MKSWAGLVLILVIVLCVSWAGGAQAPTPQRGGTIRVGITQEILNLDLHVATAFSSRQVLDLVYAHFCAGDDQFGDCAPV